MGLVLTYAARAGNWYCGVLVHFQGTDSVAGPLLKYTLVEPYARAQ